MLDVAGLLRGLRGAPPVPAVTISRAAGVAVVADWLRQHPDGGWLQSGEGERDRAARRLLFLMFLVSQGEISEWRQHDG